MRCKACGGYVPDWANYCPMCGAALCGGEAATGAAAASPDETVAVQGMAAVATAMSSGAEADWCEETARAVEEAEAAREAMASLDAPLVDFDLGAREQTVRTYIYEGYNRAAAARGDEEPAELTRVLPMNEVHGTMPIVVRSHAPEQSEPLRPVPVEETVVWPLATMADAADNQHDEQKHSESHSHKHPIRGILHSMTAHQPKGSCMSTETTIGKGGMTATVSSKGAELQSLKLNGNEYLWQADPAFWGKHAPVLFPIVGSLRNDEATCSQGTCHMARHGLARINEHQLVGVSEDGASVTYEFTDSAETREAFPYRFKFNMTYAITGDNQLTQTFKVTNTGDVDLPFSVGGHPAFNVPAPGAGNEAFEDYALKFTEPWTCNSPKIAEGGLADTEDTYVSVNNTDTVMLERESFANDAIVLDHVPGNTLTLLGTKSGHGVRVDFPGFDYIGVWSTGEAPFVALEPWTGHSTLTTEDDVLEHKRNITVIAPGESDERSFVITLL